MTTRIDRHIQALQALLAADHEEYIAEIQGNADDAAARGDVANQRMHLDHVERLKAMGLPWESRGDENVDNSHQRRD